MSTVIDKSYFNQIKKISILKLRFEIWIGAELIINVSHEVTENSVWRVATEFRENQTLLATRNNTKHLVWIFNAALRASWTKRIISNEARKSLTYFGFKSLMWHHDWETMKITVNKYDQQWEIKVFDKYVQVFALTSSLISVKNWRKEDYWLQKQGEQFF